jgi:hypothetical protein
MRETHRRFSECMDFLEIVEREEEKKVEDFNKHILNLDYATYDISNRRARFIVEFL